MPKKDETQPMPIIGEPDANEPPAEVDPDPVLNDDAGDDLSGLAEGDDLGDADLS